MATNHYCTPCTRSFVNRSAIEAHFRHSSTHAGLWCQRCDRHFAQAAHRNQHSDDSSNHWPCYEYSESHRPCLFDGYSHESLHRHRRESDHYRLCEYCDLDQVTPANLPQHGLQLVSKASGGSVFSLLILKSDNHVHSPRSTTPSATTSETTSATSAASSSPRLPAPPTCPQPLLVSKQPQVGNIETHRCEGATFTIYKPVLLLNEPGCTMLFHSISAQREYQSFSYEELRLSDYKTASNIFSRPTVGKSPWKSASVNGPAKETNSSMAGPKVLPLTSTPAKIFLSSTTPTLENKSPQVSCAVSSLAAAVANVSVQDSPIPHPEPLSTSSPTREPEKPNIDCWAACGSSFPSLAAVLQHLESSLCPRGTTNIDLHSAAASCEHWHLFIDGPYVRDLRLGRDLGAKYSNNAYPFVCPQQECDKVFQKLSGLFAHTESGTCKEGQGTDEGCMKELKEALLYRVTNGLI